MQPYLWTRIVLFILVGLLAIIGRSACKFGVLSLERRYYKLVIFYLLLTLACAVGGLKYMLDAFAPVPPCPSRLFLCVEKPAAMPTPELRRLIDKPVDPPAPNRDRLAVWGFSYPNASPTRTYWGS